MCVCVCVYIYVYVSLYIYMYIHRMGVGAGGMRGLVTLNPEAKSRFEMQQQFNNDPSIDVLLLTTHVGGTTYR